MENSYAWRADTGTPASPTSRVASHQRIDRIRDPFTRVDSTGKKRLGDLPSPLREGWKLNSPGVPKGARGWG